MSAAPSTRAIASAVMPRFYSAARLSRSAQKKRGQSPAFFRLRLRSAASLDHAVDDFHLVATAPCRRRGLGEQTLAAVFVANDDLVFHGLFRVLLDRVSGEAAAQDAEDGRNVLAPTAAHLVAQHSAHYRAADRARTRGLSGL